MAIIHQNPELFHEYHLKVNKDKRAPNWQCGSMSLMWNSWQAKISSRHTRFPLTTDNKGGNPISGPAEHAALNELTPVLHLKGQDTAWHGRAGRAFALMTVGSDMLGLPSRQRHGQE